MIEAQSVTRVAKRTAHRFGRLLSGQARKKVERQLASLSKESISRFEGRVLVDATFDNPNYWTRFSLLRAAMGFAHGREIAVLGPYNVRSQMRTARRMGIVEFCDFPGDDEAASKHLSLAQSLVDQLQSPYDVFDWQLPYDMPTWDLYDCLLRRQRRGALDITDRQLVNQVAQYLHDLEVARELVERISPDVAVLSHTASDMITYGALVWHLLSKDVPIIVPYGAFGCLHHYKIHKLDDVFDFANRPYRRDIDGLTTIQANKLDQIGSNYLAARHGGQTTDLSAVLAFKQGQTPVCREFFRAKLGWNPESPIVAVFASVWFDNPHVHGMSTFRDYQDWLQATFEVASATEDVNWLFKPHPSEDWYGGAKMRDMLPKNLPGNVRIVEPGWEATSLRDCLDGVVTCHGTVGIEMAAQGKPVIVAAEGWYHDVGFTLWPGSRRAYLDALAMRWWEAHDAERSSRLARIFAGFFFCRPAGRSSLVLGEDTDQHRLYRQIGETLNNRPQEIFEEIAALGSWMASDSRHFHTFKMLLADDYQLPPM